MSDGRGVSNIDLLRQAIRRAFPPRVYTGRITAEDERLDDPDFDDQRMLYQSLKGRKWTDLHRELIANQPDGYVLLDVEAFGAFIASWLDYSLDNWNGENEVREFVLYAFSPKRDMVPDTTHFIVGRLQSLTTEQREVIRLLLLEFQRRDPSAFQKKLAQDAVALIDSLG